MHEWIMKNHPWYKKKYFYENKMERGEKLTEREQKEYNAVRNSHRRQEVKVGNLKIVTFCILGMLFQGVLHSLFPFDVYIIIYLLLSILAIKYYVDSKKGVLKKKVKGFYSFFIGYILFLPIPSELFYLYFIVIIGIIIMLWKELKKIKSIYKLIL